MRFAPYLVCLGLTALAQLACSSNPTTTTAVSRPQLVAVDPDDFLLGSQCIHPPVCSPGGAGGGAGAEICIPTNGGSGGTGGAPVDPVGSYVATLLDVTPDANGNVPDPGTALPSSPPTSCVTQVTFSDLFLIVNHRYIAVVDTYEKMPEELFPESVGSRSLVDADSAAVEPKHTARCGGYPPSPQAAGAGGTGEAGGSSSTGGMPGIVSYASVTQTPHNCLRDPDNPAK